MLNLRRLRAAVIGGTAAAAVVLVASPGWAGQINLLATTTITTTVETTLNTNSGSHAGTNTSTSVGTIQHTDLGTLQVTTGAGTVIQTSNQTTIKTSQNTTAATSSGSHSNTSINTLNQTIQETVLYAGQPADVSIEVTESGLNIGSPFDNTLTATELTNNIDAVGTSGLTQVQASVGVGNVVVGTNAILDGFTLSELALTDPSGMVASEIAGVTLNPGAVALSPKNQMVTLVAKEALIAAVASHTGDVETYDAQANTGQSASVTAAVDVVLEDINENSPFNNSANIGGAVTNNVNVTGSSGITQIQAAAGVSNVHSASNLIVIDLNNLGNGTAFNFNQ